MKALKFIITYLEVITFIVSLITYYKYKHSMLRYFPFYLGLAAIIEFLALHFFTRNNLIMYNLLVFFQFNLFYFIFGSYLPKIQKKALLILAILFNLIYVGSFVLRINNFAQDYGSFGFVFGSIVMLLLFLAVFKELLKIDNSKGMTYNLLFWISFGNFVLFSVLIPAQALSEWETISKSNFNLVFILLFVSTAISQLIMIFGFLWCKKKYTY